MKTQTLYKRAMKEVGKLRDLNKYDRATDIMRTSCCENLKSIKVSGVDEQGLDDYYNEGDILLSSGEDFGKRKDKKESYKSWGKRTEKGLQDLYKCELTGEYCVARTTGFHSSDIAKGDNYRVKVNLGIQIRCPSFKFQKSLLDVLNEK